MAVPGFRTGLGSSISSPVYAGFLILALLVGGTGLWAYRSIDNLMWQAHQRRLEGLANRALRDAVILTESSESAQRGYLLDGEASSLAEYESRSTLACQLLVQSVKSPLWSDEEFDRIRELIDRKIVELDQTVWLIKSGRRDEAMEVYRSDRGRDLMASIKHLHGMMSARSIATTDARYAIIERSGNAAMIGLPASYGLAVAIGVLSLMAFVGQTRRATRAEAESEIRKAETLAAHAISDAAISETRAAIAEKQAAQTQAQIARDNSARLKDELLRDAELMDAISHDSRTPLNGIRQEADLALVLLATLPIATPNREAIIRCLTSTKSIVDRAKDMLDSLMESSRAERGQASVVTFEVCPVVESVVGMLRVMGDGKGLELGFDVEPGCLARTDRGMVNRILMNLVENSVKYTDHGSIGIVVNRDPLDVGVILSVSDTGRGIDDHLKSRLFRDFVQGGNRERNPDKGFGLGLANVRRMVNRLGGMIDVESQVGKGSTFTVHLPDLDAG